LQSIKKRQDGKKIKSGVTYEIKVKTIFKLCQ